MATKISYYYAGWMEKVDAQPALVPARITSRDCHTQFFAVAVPRLLASEECGIILMRLALKTPWRYFPCRQLPSSSGTTPVVLASLPSRASNSAPCAIKIVSARLERHAA